MRRIVIVAAMLAALGMAPPPAEAGDRGFGFRHFSPHAGAKFHRSPHRFTHHHHGGFFGRPWYSKSRHLGHFGRGGLVLKFGHGDLVLKFGHGDFVLKFGHGDFVLMFGHIPRFKHRHFGHRHGPRGFAFGFEHPRHFRPWYHRGFAFEGWHGVPGELRHFRESVPAPGRGQDGALRGGAPPEALLTRLEQLGFRHVPELLRQRSR